MRLQLMCLCVLGVVALGGVAHPQPTDTVTVHWELVMERGFPPGQERQWLGLLQRFPGVSIRIRTAEPGERPEIHPRARGWEVVGVLTRSNRLVVPGGNFSLADRTAIAAWLERLKADGPEAVTGKLGPFGLTESQWTELFEKMRPALGYSTVNMTQSELVARASQKSGLTIDVDLPIRAELSETKLTDELSQLSIGTALAIALRPNGLVLTVERKSGKATLRVTSADRAETFWPIGYEPKESVQHTLPALLKYLSVEINDTPLRQVLEAIGKRLEAPILVDHNGLAREAIDLDETRVTIPAERLSYKRVLEKALSQARLRMELRVDEAGTTFLWVTPLRRP